MSLLEQKYRIILNYYLYVYICVNLKFLTGNSIL